MLFRYKFENQVALALLWIQVSLEAPDARVNPIPKIAAKFEEEFLEKCPDPGCDLRAPSKLLEERGLFTFIAVQRTLEDGMNRNRVAVDISNLNVYACVLHLRKYLQPFNSKYDRFTFKECSDVSTTMIILTSLPNFVSSCVLLLL